MGVFDVRILSHEPNPSNIGEAVTITVSVTDVGGGPAGSVTVNIVSDEGNTSCTTSAISSSCSSQLVFNNPSGHLIRASVGGDFAEVDHYVNPSATNTSTYTPTVTSTFTPTTTRTRTPTASPTATVPAGGNIFIFMPIDDAYIASGSPTTNYGSATTLQVDNSPIKHFLLKFNVSGLNGKQVTSAKLRLYNVDSASKGGDFYAVSDNSWQEETLNWNNAPAALTSLLASLGSVSPNNWYEVDITSLIAGDGTYSLRITSMSSDGADYSSKEGANSPQLVITVQ
jgi:hypothetical protein